MIGQAIDIYERLGIVVGKYEIELASTLLLNHPETEKFFIKMNDEQFSELIELIQGHDYDWRMSDDQRRWDEGYKNEKRMTELLRSYLWEDIEPYVKEDWRKVAVKDMF